jgi:membrane-associated protein
MQDFHWTKLFNPEFYITMEVNGIPIGIYVVLFIVFAETGLFAGFFLPGDSLLFLSGIYTRELVQTFFYIPNDLSNVTILSLSIATAATFGNMFGYWFGSRSGNYLYTKEDSFFFKKKYLIQSQFFLKSMVEKP